MNGDDRDLSEVFDELSAPSSMARYTDRTPAGAVTHVRAAWRWPQAIAGVTAVLVALAGAGTFLALRTAREGNLATSGSGSPAGRTGAAMAYDSTSGVTVMFGGMGARGTTLDDTWLWDGARWSLASGAGPGRMAVAHLSDDPADGGVLLVGTTAPAVTPTTGGVTGCVVYGGTGSGSATATTAVAGPATSTSGRPTPATGAAAVSPRPGLGLASTPPPMPTTPHVPPCPTFVAPSEQTWIFNAQGWHRVDAARGATMPFGDAQLAYDAATGHVIAVSALSLPCGGPLPAGSPQPLIMCEGANASSGGGARSTGSGSAAHSGVGAPDLCTISACGGTIACPLLQVGATVPGGWCGGDGTRTGVWSGGRWTLKANAGPASGTGGAVLYADRDTGTAALLGLVFPGPGVEKRTGPLIGDRWMWTGSAWRLAEPNPVHWSALSAQALAAVGLPGKVMVLTASGDTWTFANAAWAKQSTTFASRAGEAMAAGPGDTVVLFGGTATARGDYITVGGGAPGSDTWTWSAGLWRRVSGVAPALPTPCPSTSALGAGCVEILPAQVPPAAVPPSSALPSPKPSANP